MLRRIGCCVVDEGTFTGYYLGMTSNGSSSPPSVLELRKLAREAGVGDVADPAPVRLDDLRRELTENQVRVARLPRLLAAKAS